jgi:hypothetical protein
MDESVYAYNFPYSGAAIIQTAPINLKIQLEVMPGADDGEVRESVARRVRENLAGQGLPSTGIEKAGEPPMRHQVSGKFRQVWADSLLGGL